MNTREDTVELLNQLSLCMPRALYNDLETTKRGVGFILDYLEQSDGEVTVGDFSKVLHVSAARIAALLKKMEQNGLVTRRASLKDARRTVVEITPAGRAASQKMKASALREVELLLDRVGKEDLNTFIKISHRIRTVIDDGMIP